MLILLCFLFLTNQVFGNDRCNTKDLGSFPKGNQSLDSKNIERPCSIQNVNCIRRYLARNTGCSPVHGPSPDPALFYNIPSEVAHANITVLLSDVNLNGLNTGKIKEFYFNIKSNTLVLEVEFEVLNVVTPNTIAEYHFRGSESVKLTYNTTLTFKKTSLTLTIRNFRNKLRAKSYVYAYFYDSKPFFKIKPNGVESKDPRIIEVNKKWHGEMALSGKEGFITQGPIYMSAYMNTMICKPKQIKRRITA